MPPPARLAVWGAKGSFCYVGAKDSLIYCKNVHAEINASDEVIAAGVYVGSKNNCIIGTIHGSIGEKITIDKEKRKITLDIDREIAIGRSSTGNGCFRITLMTKVKPNDRDNGVILMVEIGYTLGEKKRARLGGTFFSAQIPYYTLNDSNQWVTTPHAYNSFPIIPLSELCP